MLNQTLQGMLCIDFDGTITKYKKPLPKDKTYTKEDLNYPDLLKELFLVCKNYDWVCYIVTQNSELPQILHALELLLGNDLKKYINGIYYDNEICKIDKITHLVQCKPDEKYFHNIKHNDSKKINKILFIDDQEENQLLDESHELFKKMDFIEATVNSEFIREAIAKVSGDVYVKPVKKFSFELQTPTRKRSKDSETKSDAQFQL